MIWRFLTGPPSNYDEEGVLTTDRSSLTELRLLRSSSANRHTRTATIRHSHGTQSPASHSGTNRHAAPSKEAVPASAAAVVADGAAKNPGSINSGQIKSASTAQNGTAPGKVDSATAAEAAASAPFASVNGFKSTQLPGSRTEAASRAVMNLNGAAEPHPAEANHQDKQSKSHHNSKVCIKAFSLDSKAPD